jgi:hypothetical protein
MRIRHGAAALPLQPVLENRGWGYQYRSLRDWKTIFDMTVIEEIERRGLVHYAAG